MALGKGAGGSARLFPVGLRHDAGDHVRSHCRAAGDISCATGYFTGKEINVWLQSAGAAVCTSPSTHVAMPLRIHFAASCLSLTCFCTT